MGRTMSIEVVLQAMQMQVVPLERLIELFVGSLGNPILRGSEGDLAYRYERPDIRHFCLLKSVRVVSALNAMLELARGGYTQEIGVLIRTVAEFTSHIEFVLETGSEDHRAGVDRYIKAFFADSQRGLGAEIIKAQVPQGLIHAKLGETLDIIAEQFSETEGRVPAAKLYSNVYRVFSNYVHGKYPEIMDLYGGLPGQFHLRGMSATRKDAENLEQIQTYIETASNTFVIMIKSLNLSGLVETDRDLERWYKVRHEIG